MIAMIVIIDQNFFLLGPSVLSNHRDFRAMKMAIRKTDSFYISQHYYEVIRNCRKHNKFLVREMERGNLRRLLKED